MTTADYESIVWLSMIGGVLGALLSGALVRLVYLALDWWLDRQDRAYVRRLNGQRGFGRPFVLALVAAALVAFLAACAAPEPFHAESYRWYSHATRDVF